MSGIQRHFWPKEKSGYMQRFLEELQDDLDAITTLVNELRTDHATFKTAADETETLIEEMKSDVNDARSSILEIIELIQNHIVGGDPGLAIATTASKVKTANSVDFTIQGVGYTKAATDNFWTLSGTNVTTGNFQKYILYVDAAGAASIGEGTQAATAAGVTLPAITADKCIFGLLQVQNASGADFVPGTTLLNAAGITATYVDGLEHQALIDKVVHAPSAVSAANPASAPAAISAAAVTLKTVK